MVVYLTFNKVAIKSYDTVKNIKLNFIFLIVLYDFSIFFISKHKYKLLLCLCLSLLINFNGIITFIQLNLIYLKVFSVFIFILSSFKHYKLLKEDKIKNLFSIFFLGYSPISYKDLTFITREVVNLLIKFTGFSSFLLIFFGGVDCWYILIHLPILLFSIFFLIYFYYILLSGYSRFNMNIIQRFYVYLFIPLPLLLFSIFSFIFLSLLPIKFIYGDVPLKQLIRLLKNSQEDVYFGEPLFKRFELLWEDFLKSLKNS